MKFGQRYILPLSKSPNMGSQLTASIATWENGQSIPDWETVENIPPALQRQLGLKATKGNTEATREKKK